MDTVDIIIIGAGVVGLGITKKLSSQAGKNILLIEKHDSFGRETSSRNSEVIHGGLYHPEHSLKARLCITGNQLMYELCAKHNIPHRKTGKIIVANTEEEIDKIQTIFEQGKRNGVKGLKLLTREEVAEMEPHVKCKLGLWSPESGIVDTHQLMKYLEQTALHQGATIAYNCEVKGLKKAGDFFTVDIQDADGEQLQLQAPVVINSAGLMSDQLAAWAGIDIDQAGYRLYPCKGEYFSVSNKHTGKLNHLVYPAPTPISLGTHAVLSLDNRLKLGPNAFYVNELCYDVAPEHQKDFYQSAQKFLPFIKHEDLTPDMSGIRPKLQSSKEDFHDFVITEESRRGLAGLINLIGIESPGLTSFAAIADEVAKIVNQIS
jgi:L-2-hydroxyglutarate oxidase LhgO